MTTAGGAPDRFAELLAQAPPELAAPELLPSRWARDAAGSLGVDAAGLSLHDPDGLRTPLLPPLGPTLVLDLYLREPSAPSTATRWGR